MKLVISCLLMCACFLSSERVLLTGPGAWLVRTGSGLVFGISALQSLTRWLVELGRRHQTREGVSLGICGGGDREVLCWQVSWGPCGRPAQPGEGFGRGLLLQPSAAPGSCLRLESLLTRVKLTFRLLLVTCLEPDISPAF